MKEIASRVTVLVIALLFLMVGIAELVGATKGTTTVEIYQTPRSVHIVISDLTDKLSNVYARVVNPATGVPVWSNITYVDGASGTLEIVIDYDTWASLPPTFELRVGVTDNEDDHALSQWKMPMDRALPDWQHPASLDFISEDFLVVGGIIVPVDKIGLLAPYIGLTSTIIAATIATTAYVKRVKRRKEKQ